MADLVTELTLGEIPTRADLGFASVPTAVLDAARRRGDPLGDDLITELASRRGIEPGSDLLAEVRALAETEGGVFLEFLEACCYVPAWVDFAAMEPGLRLLSTTGPLLSVSHLGGLRGSALDAAEVDIAATGSFRVDPQLPRHLADDGAILFLLPLPGEVQPGGRHHALVTKVRIQNAAERRRLVEDGHDNVRNGVPINQVDLAYAMLAFAHLQVRGLLRLGLRVTDDQIASLVLLWRWVGHVLGADCHLVGTDAAAAVELIRTSLARHTLTGDASLAVLGLLDGALEAVPRPLRSIARRSLERTTAPLSGTRQPQPHNPWGMLAVRAAGAGYGALLHVPGAAAVLQRVGTTLLASRYQEATAGAIPMGDTARDEAAASTSALSLPSTRRR